MTRSNVSFLNTAAQLKHPLMEQLYNYFHGIYMPVIKPVDQELRAYTGEKIENNELPYSLVEKYSGEEKPPRNSNC
jgi:hypothetical protein